MSDTIFGTSGNDFFASASNTTLFTLAGNDTVVASGINTTIDGGEGVDLIELYIGNNYFVNINLISGGNFYIDGSYISNFENYSIILSYYSGNINFGSGNDFFLAGGNCYAFGGAGNDILQAGIYSTLHGGEGDDILRAGGFASGGPGFMYGGEGNDTLVGMGTLEGGNGNDWLGCQGGYSNAGSGDDSISIALYSATTIDGGGGNDTLIFSFTYEYGNNIDFSNASGALNFTYHDINISNIENFLVYAGEIGTFVGSSGNDTYSYVGYSGFYLAIEGFSSAALGLGNDTVNGLNGNSTINGGDGIDTIILTDISNNGSMRFDGANYLNLNSGIARYMWEIFDPALPGYDFIPTFFASHITSFEAVYGGNGNETIIGSQTNETIDGGFGNDSLDGGIGSDILIGGAGDDLLQGGDCNDALFGGAGDDVYDVAESGDTITEAANEGTDTVQTILASYTLGNNVEVLKGIAATAQTLTGNTANNRIEGGIGGDALNGGAGDDTLIGGAGVDSYEGGTGWDTVSYAGASTTVQVVMYNTAYNTGDAAGESLTGVEVLQGSSNIDVLVGDFLTNALLGGAGGDWIDGTYGGDYLYGEAGNDSLVSRQQADVLNGGADFDFARYDYADAGLNVFLHNPSQNSGWALGDTLVSIEGIAGSYFTDNLQGDAVGNVIYGLGGDDYIVGLGGADLMIGGAGADLFHYVSTADGGDGIQDFGYGADRISVNGTNFGLGYLAGGGIESFRFASGTAATYATSQFIYNGATGQLWYDHDGTGAGVKVLLATLQAGATVAAADILVI
jgi:Ca2+-binding RTX toxin-like protein